VNAPVATGWTWADTPPTGSENQTSISPAGVPLRFVAIRSSQALKLPCSYSRRVMRRGLAALSGRSIYINRSAIVGPEELAFVASMLGKMSSAELRDVVMIRLQCSRAKAYKLIKRAIEAKGKGAQAAPKD
jgi:hypothetical protein